MVDTPRSPTILSGPPQDRTAAVRSQSGVLASRTLNLYVGKDLFFRGAGDAPNYDWPNPTLSSRRKALDASIRSQGDVWVPRNATFYPNKDVFPRGIGLGPNYDWPNPSFVRRVQGAHEAIRSESGVWTDRNIALYVGKDTFLRGPGYATTYDWPNPVLPKQFRLIDLVTSDRGAAPAVQAPFYQTNWPVPRGPANPISITSNGITLLGFDTFYGDPGQVPTWVFPNPNLGKPFPIDLRTHINTPKAYLLPSPIGRLLDFPNPRGYVPSISLRTWTNIPFTRPENVFWVGGPAYDYPNPRGYRRSIDLLTWINQPVARPDTFFGLAGKPNYDWPNPTLRIPPLNKGVAFNSTILIPPIPVTTGNTNWMTRTRRRRGR